MSDSDFPSAIENISSHVFAELLQDGNGEEISARDFGDRYNYRAVLGEGGQGIVIEAHDDLLDREVAIKALKKRHNPSHINMLTREAKIGARLEHPNILPTYDLGLDEIESPLLVMRKIEGESIEALLKKLSANNQLSRSRWRLLNIFMAVLNAVEFAHSRDVLHLDLKPANISLGAHGEIYVIDWGFARRKNEKLSTRPGGTMHYIAPERLYSDNFDERADIFSLGVILYRLLTGRHPRDTGKITFQIYRDTYQNFPLIPAINRDHSIAPELSAIALKAMAEDPDERYQTVGAMINDLERFMEMLPVSAYREGTFERWRRQIKKHKKIVSAIVAGFFLCAISAYALYSRYETRQEKFRAENEKREWEIAEQHAQEQRNRELRLRYTARGILKRADDLLEKSRLTVENTPTPEAKNALLSPVFALVEKALQVDATYADVYELRARANKLAFNWASALSDYEQAYQLDSSYLMALYSAGMLLSDVFQQPESAREKFRLMKTVSPDDEYAELGQAQVDISSADKYLKLSPENPAYHQRKDLAADLYDNVLTRLEAIEKINPALSDIWYLRGLVYQKSPRLFSQEKARTAYDQFLSTRRDSPSAFHNRGDARQKLHDIDGAIDDYTSALKVDPNFLWSLRNRGYLLYREKKNTAAALADINRAITLAPEKAWSYIDRGTVYEGNHEHEKALADYQRALQIEPHNALILYRLGVSSFYQRQLPDAEKYFSDAIKDNTDEDNSTMYHRRGVVFFAQEKYADATTDFENALLVRQRVEPQKMIYPALMRFLALKLSGQPVDVNDFGKQLNAPTDKAWLTALGSFYLGEANENDVLRLAGDVSVGTEKLSPEQNHQRAQKNAEAICEARFYLGAFFMAHHEPEKARAHFTAAVATNVHLYMEYTLAKIWLEKK